MRISLKRGQLATSFYMTCRLVIIAMLVVESYAQEESDVSPALNRDQINKLDDEDYPTRVSAHEALSKWLTQHPKEGASILCRYYFEVESPETKVRLESIIREHFFSRSKAVLGISYKEKLIKLSNGRDVKVMQITRVTAGKSAHKGGILRGDEIIRMGGEMPKPGKEVFITKADITFLPIGEKVPFIILRDGDFLVLSLRIEGRRIIDSSKENKQENEAKFNQWLEKQNK